MAIHPGIFRQYDIRGIVDKDLTVDAATAIGRAYGTLLRQRDLSGAVSVGRDNRPSGGLLRDALVEGLTSTGANVIDIGVVPTPLMYWSLHHLPVVGGIQITGSHNPPEYNGFKLCVGHESLHGSGIEALRDLIVKGDFAAGSGSVRSEGVIDRYVDDVVARTGPLKRRLKVVIDCGNGVGAVVSRQLFDRMGIDVS